MEKKEIKIVGLDLDGTLLTDKKELLPYTKNVIGEALQNGTVVLVATGTASFFVFLLYYSVVLLSVHHARTHLWFHDTTVFLWGQNIFF